MDFNLVSSYSPRGDQATAIEQLVKGLNDGEKHQVLLGVTGSGKTFTMFVTGPDVVKTVTNETVTAEELGGASVHTTKSSIADRAYDNDVEALLQMRRLIDFLPSSNTDDVPEWPSFDDAQRLDKSLDTLIPDTPNKPYDIKELIHKVADEGDFFEIQEAHGGDGLGPFLAVDDENRPDQVVSRQHIFAHQPARPFGFAVAARTVRQPKLFSGGGFGPRRKRRDFGFRLRRRHRNSLNKSGFGMSLIRDRRCAQGDRRARARFMAERLAERLIWSIRRSVACRGRSAKALRRHRESGFLADR